VRETVRNSVLRNGRKLITVGGLWGINTPRSRTVTAIFQSSEPPRKISELPTFENSADCSLYGRNLRENLRNLRTANSRSKTAAGYFPWGEDQGLEKMDYEHLKPP
jgi:hypothetical protein